MFNYIASGTTRDVYAINDDLVIKIAQNMDSPASWGVRQCRDELSTFLKFGNKLPLCKILVDMSSETRIIMERVVSIEEHPHNLDLDQLDDLMWRLSFEREDDGYLNSLPVMLKRFAENILKSGLTREEISSIIYDVERHNIGVKDGDLIIFDYGLLKD